MFDSRALFLRHEGVMLETLDKAYFKLFTRSRDTISTTFHSKKQSFTLEKSSVATCLAFGVSLSRIAIRRAARLRSTYDAGIHTLRSRLGLSMSHRSRGI